MANRGALTRAQAGRYRSGSRAVKPEFLDAVCAVTGFNRECARRALKRAVGLARSSPGRVPPTEVWRERRWPLEKCWAMVNAPACEGLAPLLG